MIRSGLKLPATTLLCCGLFCGTASAQTPPSAANPDEVVVEAALVPATATLSDEVRPESPSPAVSEWERWNRRLVIALATVDREYVERDLFGVTADGILDEENGSLSGVSASLRWQGTRGEGQRLVPWIEAGYRLHAGSTTYRGYLQDLNTGAMIPHVDDTGNVIGELLARVGTVHAGQGGRWQLMPFLEARSTTWMRDLGQYDETYQHLAAGLGVLLQCRLSPTWMASLDLSADEMLLANIEVPFFGISETLGTKRIDNAGLALEWRASERGGMYLALHFVDFAYGQSAVSNGMIEPPSTTAETLAELGFSIRF